MNHTYTATYENVKIRPLVESDIESLREWRNNPENTRYLRKLPYITSEQQANWFQTYLKNEDEITFAIDEIKELNRIVGSAALYDFKSDQVEFGKILIGHKSAHGKKVGYHATKLIVELAFRTFPVNTIVLKCYAANVAALRIYEKVGFRMQEQHETEENGIEYVMCIHKEEVITCPV